MQKLLLFALLAAAPAFAQKTSAPSPKSDWTHVQVLPAGTGVHIKTFEHGNTRCAVEAVDAGSITCGGVIFKRSSIHSIKTSHKLRSTLIGAAVGYGAAVGATVGYAASCGLNCRILPIGLFDVGAIVAVPVVFGIYDLTAGTIYKASTP